MSLFDDTYLAPGKPGEGIFKDKGSKFLGFAFPVRTEKEVKEHVLALKKEHPKARHWCYAFRLGYDKQLFRANDDGEPSGTAGRPILGQIQSRDLSDVAVIVVRYFGGTLLGVGGLIQAYKTAASEALNQAGIIEKKVMERYELRFPYDRMSEVMKLIKDNALEQQEQDFGASCTLKISIRKAEAERIVSLLKKIEGLGISFTGMA
jgi:uncharacterized YigZ family protein